jgi:hypothetical protein
MVGALICGLWLLIGASPVVAANLPVAARPPDDRPRGLECGILEDA